MKTAARIAILGALSRRWLDRNFRFRRLAVARLVRKSGFAPAVAEAMLDALFRELIVPKLRLLVRVEAGSSKALDAARGPRHITHVLSGNIPNPGVLSVVLGLLVRSENVVKPSSRDEGIVDFYLASLRACDRKLAASCRLLKASDRTGLQRAITASDLVIAYGSDESVAAIKAMTGPRTKFISYGHRVSFSMITRDALVGARLTAPLLARKTALDVWMMDKRGCLSPSLFFVPEFGAQEFCGKVLKEMARLEKGEGKMSADGHRAARIRAVENDMKLSRGTPRRTSTEFFGITPNGRYFVRASRLSQSGWTDAPGVDIRTYQNIQDVYHYLSKFKPVLQAIALECASADRPKITRKLVRLGFNRICHAGALQYPPITWPHDGRPNFSDWLTGVNGKISR